MSYLENKIVLVTGGAGFLGSNVVDELKKYNPSNIVVPRSSEYDLRKRSDVDSLFSSTKPTIVIHLAGKVGGIGETKAKPAEFFYDNSSMALNLIDASYRHKVDKFVGLGSVCAYPKFAPIPFKEESLWEGYPEETNGPYGMAKKFMLVQTQAYYQQYGFRGIHLLAVNLYGPGDNFDPHSSHVVPAMIRKLVDAKEKDLKEVIFWGDGTPTREFLYVTDCARGIVLAAEHYTKPDPVNLGSGMEISIKELAYKLKNLIQYDGDLVWDTSKPNGQPRRCLDVSKAKKEFNFSANVNFDEGLKQTVEWYIKNKKV
ncbi:MAG: GDP-L-fucose synthase [Candidatus Micrarchaeota archaeon]